MWKKTGAIYDGDWQAGLRHGFGTYSVKKAEGVYMKEYAGGWKNDMRHVSLNYNPYYFNGMSRLPHCAYTVTIDSLCCVCVGGGGGDF